MKGQCGTRARYCSGCRCDDCRAANTQYSRDKAAAARAAGHHRLCRCGCALLLTGRDDRRAYIDGHQPGWVGTRRPNPAVYAEQLLEISAQLIGAVHDEGPEQIRIHLRRALVLPHPAGVDPVEALATILAAQVDPESTESQRLGWVQALPVSERAG